MRSLKLLGAAFCASSMLCTINVANAKIFVGTSQVVESVNLIDKDLIESQNNELIAGFSLKDKEKRERERRERERRLRERRERERRLRDMKMKRKMSLGTISVKSLPYSVNCPPENKKLKIKLNKKTGEIVVRFAKGKKFYQGNFDKALKVFEDTYGDKCVK